MKSFFLVVSWELLHHINLISVDVEYVSLETNLAPVSFLGKMREKSLEVKQKCAHRVSVILIPFVYSKQAIFTGNESDIAANRCRNYYLTFGL